MRYPPLNKSIDQAQMVGAMPVGLIPEEVSAIEAIDNQASFARDLSAL